MELLPFCKRLAMAAFWIALVAGLLWMAGASVSDGAVVVMFYATLVAAIFAFNTFIALVIKLNLSDAKKGTVLIVLPLAGIALVASRTDNRPTYQQASEAAHESAGMVSYKDVAGTSDCSSDCSGHEAGFEWARENGVNMAWDCPSSGNPSFIEGCGAYAGYVESEMDRLNWDGGSSASLDYP